MSDADEPLPLVVRISTAEQGRLPSQRIMDLIRHLEGGRNFGEVLPEMPTRISVFRVLLRDYPDRDPTSLWLHSYDVEPDIVEADPTNGKLPTSSPPSVGTGVASP